MTSVLAICLASGWAWATPPEGAYDQTVRLVEGLYLHPEDVREGRLLRAGAERLADRLDWLMVREENGMVHLSHGNGEAIGSMSVGGMETLPSALIDLENLVRNSGYPIGDVDLRLAILQGLTDALDRYSRLLADDAKARFDVRLKGTLVGIGASFSWTGEGLEITSVVPGGPADDAGVRVGDLLERIDGRSVVSMPASEAARRIRGVEGTQVSLTLKHSGRGKSTLSLTREQVIVSNVQHRVLEGNVGYVSIDNISQKTVYNLEAALSSLRMDGALDHGLVLDLRGNTGGSMKESARAVDVFVDEGLLLRTVGRNGERVQSLQERMTGAPGGTAVQVPLVVLVDDRTASGSEIMAGSLLELERAVLVGTRTYGKGSVQKLYSLDESTDLKLTVAEYILANERQINHLGLVPDAVIGRVVVTADGVRFYDWDESWQRTPWDEILPWVRDTRSRSPGKESEDLPVELARRTVMHSQDATRESTLQALHEQLPAVRQEQEALFTHALERKGLDWSPAAGENPVLSADVEVYASSLPEGQLELRARVRNRGEEPLARTLIQLTSSSGLLDGVVIPVGAVAGRGSQEAVVRVGLPVGRMQREDIVDIQLRSAGRPPLDVGQTTMEIQSTWRPEIRLSGRLVDDEDGTWRAEVTVLNDSDRGLEDVSVRFLWPGDLDVEMLDHAIRIPKVPAGDRVRADLLMRPGADAPRHLPLRVQIDADNYGRLARWPMELDVDGATRTLRAPTIERVSPQTSLPTGPQRIAFQVRDEQSIDHVLVYIHGQKVGWESGGKSRVDLSPELSIREGLNYVYVTAVDNHGVLTREQFVIRGEAATAVDAIETESPSVTD